MREGLGLMVDSAALRARVSSYDGPVADQGSRRSNLAAPECMLSADVINVERVRQLRRVNRRVNQVEDAN
jgi:hypothetical protein